MKGHLRGRCYGCRRHAGLTLVELLVTVVILGFVIALMSGAFFQVAQVLRVALDSGNGFQARWQQRSALRDIVANLVYPGDDVPSLRGRPDRFEGLTLASPVGAPGVAEWVSVRIAQENEQSRLLLAPREPVDGLNRDQFSNNAFSDTDSAKEIEWTRWPGRAEFRYVDGAGSEYLDWPPQGGNVQPDAPAAVMIRNRDGGLLLRVALYEGGRPPPRTVSFQDFLNGGQSP